MTPARWNDFWINIYASGIFFLAEILLLLILIPVVLGRIERRRWQPQGTRFVRDILVSQSYKIDIIASKIKLANDESMPFMQAAPWLQKHFHEPMTDHWSAMVEVRKESEATLDIYQRALTPELHRAYVDWREAAKAWEDELQSFGQDVHQWVHIGYGGDDRRIELVSRFRKAFADLSQASHLLRECGKLPEMNERKGRPDLEVRPEFILTDEHWGWLDASLKKARNSVDFRSVSNVEKSPESPA